MADPVNYFSTGKQCQVVIRHPLAAGGRLELPTITDFDVKPTWHDIKSSGMDGYTRTQHVFESMTVTFSVDRFDATIDNFCSALVQAYFLNGYVPDGRIEQSVIERDGSTTVTEFTGVSFKPDDLGTWKKEDRVPQKVSATAMAYRRL